MNNSNKDKTPNPVIDEVLNTPIPGTPEPITYDLNELLSKDPNEVTAQEMDYLSAHRDDLTEEQQVSAGLKDSEEVPLPTETPETPETPEEPTPPKKEEKKVVTETEEEKDKKYKNQQTEAQILAEKQKEINSKVDEAQALPEPSEEELKEYVMTNGGSWDELTTYERSLTKKSFLNEKKLSLITEAVQSGKDINERATKVDSFLETIDGQVKYAKLKDHEEEFRKFAMQKTHRGVDPEILLGYFLNNLPARPNRNSLFTRGGGGDKVVKKTGIEDADTAAALRTGDPREYKRQVKAGQIKIEV